MDYIMLDYLFNWMGMLDIVLDYLQDYGLWVMRFYIGQTYGNVINYVIIEKWSMCYSTAYECKQRIFFYLC